ncbi:MAG: nuclear transport factor 2 family protein [Rikenellaceae bacterium]
MAIIVLHYLIDIKFIEMKNLSKAMMLSATILAASATTFSVEAQTKVSEKMTIYTLPQSKLHVYQTGDVMGDVSFIIEGEKELVILEQPLFWANIEEFNAYVQSLDKPIDKVVANYHSLGLADYPTNKIMMPEAMVEFCKSDNFKGMSAKFAQNFGEAADFRPFKKAKAIEVPSNQQFAGIELKFYEGAKSDFPAASILIDNGAFYTHFSPTIAHFSAMQLKSPQSVDFILEQLNLIKESGVEYIFGSHGAGATQKEVEFQIEYLEKVKSLISICKDSDIFTQQLIVAYPSLAGAENISTFAKNLYQNEVIDSEKAAVKVKVQDYFNMVSNIDEDIAKELWADNSNISIITPRTQFFGLNSIMNDFLRKTFSSLTYRKLSSYSEVVNIYGNSANVQLYWKFDTKDAQGNTHQTKGRETLVFSKINGSWKLVHVHYSRMPE